MKALVVIDFTNDFVDGKLPVGQPAIDIQERVAELTQTFIDHGDWVVMAVDMHEEGDIYHPETALFPPHNIRDTVGRELYGELKQVYQNNEEMIYWMNKTRYSAFCGTDLDIRLRERGIKEVHLIGVCTDICILHTAIEAYNKGYHITIHEDAVASFNPEGHLWALQHFRTSLGANIIKR
ncbi:cysteine hydrolase family protein [Paenibacillus pini]|uniref:Nicotinamidase n=1 Tax=Paenibacillus pini JCM 16418 TaxID=1236976 RepID=W7YYR6_9BACL|nr:isochorismatase family cysteine hydrolase [Paenibacillus pini]GAF09781.1 nicotinamidase [Paenibacillus pini JCM 16418]